MLAGGIKLFQTVSSDEISKPLAVGTSATLGDMAVSVDAISERDSMTIITVTMSGVDGADAQDGWGLFVAGDKEIRTPIAAQDGAISGATKPCRGATTLATTALTCQVYFSATSGTPTVIYKRATLTERWSN
jgi:hypothetical protein